jgi:phage terminase small subunit
LAPPSDLDGPARALFVEIVACHRPDHFRSADSIPLAMYCRAAIREQQAAGEMDACPVTPDGRPSPWLAIWRESCRTVLAFSRQLRLSPLSRPGSGSKPSAVLSYYERQQLEADEAGDDAH